MPENKEQTLREAFDKFKVYGNKTAILNFAQEKKQELKFEELTKLIHRLAAGLSKDGLKQQETVMLLAIIAKNSSLSL